MRIATIAAALAVTAVTTATAQSPCSPKDAAAAGKALDRVNTWGELHKTWRDWHRCDSGATADGFTDAIMRLGVDWKNMDALAKDMGEDPQYHDFILAHVKADPAKDDRDALYSRAKASCPKGLDKFCGEIVDATAPEKPFKTPDLMQPLPPIQSEPAKK